MSSKKLKKLNEAFQYVDDKYLDMAESEKRKKKPVWFYGTILAACICLMLIIPVVVMAMDFLGLRSMTLQGVPDESLQPDESASPFVEEKMETIGLSGYINSPEMQALNEWQAFYDSYVETIEVIDSDDPDDPMYHDSRYLLYGVYDQKMCDKLEEIAGKYGLKLHTDMDSVSPEELSYRVGGEFTGGIIRYWGYIYENGTFQFDGDMHFEDGDVGYQLRRSVKGTFDEVTLNVGYLDDYREIQYVTACGERVMLALGTSKALIYADFEDCFITVNVLSGTMSGFTEERLKKMADEIDFTVLKKVIVPDMRGDSIP